jgi:uncharacterized protein
MISKSQASDLFTMRVKGCHNFRVREFAYIYQFCLLYSSGYLRFIPIIALIFTHANMAHSAGFDCHLAFTTVEKQVCGNKQLSDLDDEVSRVYRMKRWKKNENALAKIDAEQKKWLKFDRNICKDVPCLLNAYTSRLKQLEQIKTPGAKGIYEASSAGFSYMEKYFLKDLQTYVHISEADCPVIVYLVERFTTGHDESYGAFCQLPKGRVVTLCDDTMVGKFTIGFGGAIDGAYLLDFTKKNCPPGG